MKTIRLGTRASDLAMVQARYVAGKLELTGNIAVEIVKITTRGDKDQVRPLRELEGRGYFTKEIEDALLLERIDAAVHSFKDMPSQPLQGLMVVALTEREDARDALLIHHNTPLNERLHDTPADGRVNLLPLESGAVVGSSSERRIAQIKAMRQDIRIKDLRGNVPTRIEKLIDGMYSAIVLAAAGLNRLNLKPNRCEVRLLDVRSFVPAPGQGVIAVEMHEDHAMTGFVKRIIHNEDSGIACGLERFVQSRFGGGCGLPLGVYAQRKDAVNWRLFGFWGGGKEPRWAEVEGAPNDALAEELYKRLDGLSSNYAVSHT